MSELDKTKAQLVEELRAFRARVAALEQSEAEHKQAEEKLRVLERAVQQSIDGIAVSDLDGVIQFVNPAWAQAHGHDVAELLGRPLAIFHTDEQMRKEVIPGNRRVMQDGAHQAEIGHVRKDGTTFPTWMTTTLLRDEEGNPIGLVGTARDITELKQTEETLRDSEERMRQLFDHAPVGYHELDEEGRITRVNRTELDMLGYARTEILGRHAWEFTVQSEESRLATQGKLRGTVPPGRSLERTLRRKDSSTLPVLIEDRLLRDEQGRITGILSTVHDITDLKQAEAAIAASEANYREIFNAANDAIFVHDIESGAILDVNRKMCETYGYTPEEARRINVGDLSAGAPPYTQTNALKHIERAARGQPQIFEWLAKDKAGRLFWVEVSLKRATIRNEERLLAIVRDISERRRAEEERRELEAQVQQARKLESLGILAGGIAHDFNNLLVGVLGNASLALMELSEDSPARHSVQQIEKAGQRASELTNQMLAYSGRGRFVVKVLDLNELVAEMAHLAKAGISKKITLQYHFAEGLPAIEADATQIRQVVMNLITNAAEAIGDDHGKITVRTSIVEANRRALSQTVTANDLPEGPYVCLEVIDTGAGMDAATEAKVFDPFFTTKLTGRGLGLSGVLGIVRGHRGAVSVSSTPNMGTTFTVLLPPCDRPVKETVAIGQDLAQWTGRGCVLVVDDEEPVRTVAEKILSHAGFRTRSAGSGRDGIETFRKHADEIAAVLLDVTMPDMNGEEVLRELRRIRPDVRILLSSGYDEHEVTRRFAEEGIASFIHKPYVASALLDKLRRLLED